MPFRSRNGKLTTTWSRIQARRRWQTAIRKVMQANRIHRNRATAKRRIAFRKWARQRNMTSQRYKNWNWLGWAKYKRQRWKNSGGSMKAYKFYR